MTRHSTTASALAQVSARVATTAVVITAAGDQCLAHGFGGSGLLHPLTGVDHMLAMLAVGAWSAQIGGRALILVPAAFVLAMALGFVPGMIGLRFAGVEGAIALSVLGLGAAIVLRLRTAWSVAAVATLCFGLAHGYAHGAEIPRSENLLVYITGFLATTAGLHLIGAVGGLLVLEQRQGDLTLRAAGAATVVVGVLLLRSQGW